MIVLHNTHTHTYIYARCCLSPGGVFCFPLLPPGVLAWEREGRDQTPGTWAQSQPAFQKNTWPQITFDTSGAQRFGAVCVMPGAEAEHKEVPLMTSGSPSVLHRQSLISPTALTSCFLFPGVRGGGREGTTAAVGAGYFFFLFFFFPYGLRCLLAWRLRRTAAVRGDMSQLISSPPQVRVDAVTAPLAGWVDTHGLEAR